MMIGSLDPIDMAKIKTTTPARRKADGVVATLGHQIIPGLRAMRMINALQQPA